MSFAFDSALMNAMIHDGFDPNIRHIYYRCDICHYPYFYVMMEEEHPLPHGRLNIRILLCPKCGAKELDCSTTHYLPDYLPESVLPFIGEFMMFNSVIHNMALSLERDNEEKP